MFMFIKTKDSDDVVMKKNYYKAKLYKKCTQFTSDNKLFIF